MLVIEACGNVEKGLLETLWPLVAAKVQEEMLHENL
jgi:hypothetical protein